MTQQPGLGVSGVNVALDLDDGGDVRMPVGVGQSVCRLENGDGAAFVAVAALVVAVDRPERCRGRGDFLDCLVQGRLVVLDANDQGNADLCGDLEMFFWQCIASSVTTAPGARPSSASKACAAGISLDFSAISI